MAACNNTKKHMKDNQKQQQQELTSKLLTNSNAFKILNQHPVLENYARTSHSVMVTNFCMQSWAKHLQTFSLFSTIPFHHKWKGLHYYHQKVNVRAVFQVAERLNIYYQIRVLICLGLMASTQPTTREPNFDVFQKLQSS